MSEENFSCLIGKYLNGYKIVKVEKDPFYKGQINLFTDEWKLETFNDRSLVIFRLREEANTSKYYQELVDKEKNDLQQRIDKAIEYLKETTFDFGNDEMIFDKCNAYKLLSILQGKEMKERK